MKRVRKSHRRQRRRRLHDELAAKPFPAEVWQSSLHREGYHPPGTPPATLRASGEEDGDRPRVTLFEYDADGLREEVIGEIETVFPCRDNSKVSWINIDGLNDVELVRRVGAHFRLHPLTLEDTLNLHQRPKMEEYDSHTFVLLQIPYILESGALVNEQLSLFLGETFVITFQEDRERDVFEPVRQRIRQGRGYARGMKNDYLAYMLIDAVVDHYFPVVETVGESIEQLEDAILEGVGMVALEKLYGYRRMLTQIRRFAWPQREVLAALVREDVQLVLPHTKVFLRDCVDHSLQILEAVDNYRDVTASMMELYVSQQSNRTNEVVKVLTIMSSIFIPLTFLAGVYGMNFNPEAGPLSMPELNMPYGYVAVMLFMAAVAGGMVLYFKRKGWF